MSKKPKWVGAEPTPEQRRVQQNLGNFLAQYGTQTRGYYPGQLNAPMNPYLSLAGSMLSGMYSAGQPSNVVNGMPNMNWEWPQYAMMSPAIPTQPQTPAQSQASSDDQKKGPTIFAVGAR